MKAHSLVSSWKEGQIIVWIYVISPDYRVSQCWLKLMFYVRADLMLISNFCDIYIFIEEGDIGISSMAMTLYNYCLHMRWTSKIINTRVVIFSKGFSPSENHLSRVDNLMFTSYEGNDCFIIPKLKKKGFSTHFRLSGIVDRVTTYCLPLHYICLGCSLGCLPRLQIFSKTSKLSYYFYIVQKIYMV